MTRPLITQFQKLKTQSEFVQMQIFFSSKSSALRYGYMYGEHSCVFFLKENNFEAFF
jgi:hypothetical protein